MSFENHSTVGAICPHCEHMHAAHDDNYGLYSEDTDAWTCQSCGEDFAVDVFIRHSWTTAPLEDQS